MSWTNWYLPIGWPNVSRSRAYSTERSRHARTTPHAPAATVNLPWSSECIAISNPWPSSPIRFSVGTATFTKKSSPVEPAQIPSLFSVSALVNPFMPFSSTNALTPLWPADGSVFAKTSAWSATVAYEIQFFCPFRTYTSPSRRAVERIEATSDPAPGSVSPKQASFSPFACGVSQRCFCSSVPYLSSESELSPTWTEISVRNAASPRSISSQASASATKSSPAPPYSPRIPSSAMPSISSRSSLWSMSFWIATGSTRSSTNARTVSWISRCSSLSSKSTRALYVPPPTWRRYQNELVHQAPISVAKRRPPATGSTHEGNRCMRTINTFVAKAPKNATPKKEWTAIRVSKVWNPSLNTQWYATGIVARNASRPDQRWTAPTRRGLGQGSRRKIQAAVKSWVTP